MTIYDKKAQPTYCPDCECYSCTMMREKAERDAKLRKQIDTWAWNLSPLECAERMQELDLRPEDVERVMRELLFSERDIGRVIELAEELAAR